MHCPVVSCLTTTESSLSPQMYASLLPLRMMLCPGPVSVGRISQRKCILEKGAPSLKACIWRALVLIDSLAVCEGERALSESLWVSHRARAARKMASDENRDRHFLPTSCSRHASKMGRWLKISMISSTGRIARGSLRSEIIAETAHLSSKLIWSTRCWRLQ